jgi:hypothetical protein
MKEYNAILSLFISWILFSCTERIEIYTDKDFTRLVVDGSITTDRKAHSVVLSATSDYFSDEPMPRISGATISISDGNKIYSLSELSPGIYSTNPGVTGIAGHLYKLAIHLATPVGGYSDYTATSTIFPSPKLDSITLHFYRDYSLNGMWEVRGYLKDPPDMNFYRFLVSRNGEMITDTLQEWFVTDDRFFNGGYVNGGTVAFLHQHRTGEALTSGDRVTIELDAITKEYANFIQDAQSEMRGSYPLFTGPPANVKGNMSNGAIGFFAAYSISRASVLVPWPEP